MSLNPSKNRQQQQNVSAKPKQKTEVQFSQTLPSTTNAIKFSVPDQRKYKIPTDDVLSDIAESISKEQLTILIAGLKQKQHVVNITLPKLERKEKSFQLSTLKLQRQELLSKYETEKLRRQKQLQAQEAIYDRAIILGEPILKYRITEEKNKPENLSLKKKEIVTSDQKIEKEQLRQNQLQKQENLYERKGKEIVTSDQKIEKEQLRQKQLQKQEDLYKRKGKEIVTSDQKIEKEQLRQKQLQKQEDLYEREGKEIVTSDHKIENQQLRQKQLQKQENLYEREEKEIVTSDQKIEEEQLRQKQLQKQENLYEREGKKIATSDQKIENQQLRQKQLQKQENLYEREEKEIVTFDQKIEKEQLRQNQLQKQENLYERKGKEIVTSDQKIEKEQLRQKQLQKQENLYEREGMEIVTSDQKIEKEQLRQKQLQKQENIYEREGKEIVTSDQKIEKEQLRQKQLQKQENLYEREGMEIVTSDQKIEKEQLRQKQLQKQENIYEREGKEIVTSDQKIEKEQLRQKQLQKQENLYESVPILEYPALNHKPLILPQKKREISTSEQKIEQEELRNIHFQEQEDKYGSIDILGESILEYDLAEVPHVTINKSRKQSQNNGILTPELKLEQEKLRQIQLQEQEDVYGSMNILGDSVLEYDLQEVPYATHNKPRTIRKKEHKNKEVLTPEQKKEQEQLRQVQLQEQKDLYGSMNILGDTILEYDLNEVPYATHNKARKQPHKKVALTPEQKMEQEELRQTQLKEQEDLYEDMDLLGEANPKLSSVSPNHSIHKDVKHKPSDTDTIISIPPDDTAPQTSSGPRRVSKYLSPEQVAQLAKIRKKRYEQQEAEDEVVEETVPNVLKENYSFRQPNALLRSPRELIFRKSIVDVKKNKEKYSKSLALPVINFPPSNWPTPIIPEIEQDLDSLRQEQREYFLAMQQARVTQKTQNADQSQSEDIESIQGGPILNSTPIQNQNPIREQNNYQRNNEVNLDSKEDSHILITYVYVILCLQWFLVTGIVSLFKYHEPSTTWLQSFRQLTWLYILCALIVLIVLLRILPATRNMFPINLVMLILFTLLVAFLFSFAQVNYPNNAVLLALICTCTICVTITGVFFRQTEYYFTFCCGISLCLIIILFILGIFYFIIEITILHIVYAASGVVLYSIYLVWYTNVIVKGSSLFQIELDNYILGAIHLNLDFIFIIVDKLLHT